MNWTKTIGILAALLGVGANLLSTVSEKKTMEDTIKKEVAKAIKNQ